MDNTLKRAFNNTNCSITTVTPLLCGGDNRNILKTSGVTVVIYEFDKKLDDKIKTPRNNVTTVFSTSKKFAP